MSSRRQGRIVGLLAIMVGAVIVMAGCAAPAPPTPSPSASAPATPEPAAYDGPLMFVGDEIDAFLLTAAEISDLLPDVSDVSDPIAGTDMYSDGGGAQFDPEECQALTIEQQVRATGARSVQWRIGDVDLGPGTLRVLQFGSVAQAEERIQQLRDASEECASFRADGTGTFTDVASTERDGILAVAGVLRLNGPGYAWNAFQGYAQVGNVLVEIIHEFAGETTFDSEAVVEALAGRAALARTALIDKLTVAPPASAPPVAVDAATPVADWPIVFGAVGPLALGDDAKQAASEVPGVDLVQSEQQPDLLRVTVQGSTSNVDLRVDDSGAIDSIEVGAHFSESGAQNGALLPSAEGVRVGDPFSAAAAAFPEGSKLRVISAGNDVYMIADRSGQVIWFTAPYRGSGTADEAITSISIEDASTWTYLRF